MGPKALLADDDPMMRRLCLGILELAGCEVNTASDGREAVEVAKRDLPQLIVMDVFMPVMTGLEALSLLKLDQATRHIPVIMISGEADLQMQAHLISSGAAAFLPKPFRAADLLKTARELLLRPITDGKPV
jgi:twitching motility two-component system response regulator PilH